MITYISILLSILFVTCLSPGPVSIVRLLLLANWFNNVARRLILVHCQVLLFIARDIGTQTWQGS